MEKDFSVFKVQETGTPNAVGAARTVTGGVTKNNLASVPTKSMPQGKNDDLRAIPTPYNKQPAGTSQNLGVS
jgi:hypothetical protein